MSRIYRHNKSGRDDGALNFKGRAGLLVDKRSLGHLFPAYADLSISGLYSGSRYRYTLTDSPTIASINQSSGLPTIQADTPMLIQTIVIALTLTRFGTPLSSS